MLIKTHCNLSLIHIFFQDIDADILCIQESKMQEGQLELDTPGYYQYWNYAKKKGSVSYTHLDVYKRQELAYAA